MYMCLPASVAQLDAPSDWRPGDRGFNPRRGRQHSFVETDCEIFSTVIPFLPLIQEVQLSVSGERMCTILVNRLEDYTCPVNVWLGKLTALDMTPLGWLGHKTSTQTIYMCLPSNGYEKWPFNTVYTGGFYDRFSCIWEIQWKWLLMPANEEEVQSARPIFYWEILHNYLRIAPENMFVCFFQPKIIYNLLICLRHF